MRRVFCALTYSNKEGSESEANDNTHTHGRIASIPSSRKKEIGGTSTVTVYSVNQVNITN